MFDAADQSFQSADAVIERCHLRLDEHVTPWPPNLLLSPSDEALT